MKRLFLVLIVLVASPLFASDINLTSFNLIDETSKEFDERINKAIKSINDELKKVEQEKSSTEDVIKYDSAWRKMKYQKGTLIIVRDIKNMDSVLAQAQKDNKIVVKAKDVSPIIGITEVSFSDTKPDLESSFICNKISCRLIRPYARGGTDWQWEKKNKFWYRIVENHNLPERTISCKCEGDCSCPNCKCSQTNPVGNVAPSQPQYPIYYQSGRRR